MRYIQCVIEERGLVGNLVTSPSLRYNHGLSRVRGIEYAQAHGGGQLENEWHAMPC